ncbi:MAG TPA: P-loop NTPase fold protein [Ktedonobacterales bacterium]
MNRRHDAIATAAPTTPLGGAPTSRVRTPSHGPTRQPQFSHNILDNADPSLQDDLLRNAIAEDVVERVQGKQSPRVIGIYGSWGAGKSYLLSLIINKLLERNKDKDSSKKVVVCAFLPWEYEVEGDLSLGLIKSLREVDKQFPGRNPQIAQPGGIRKSAKTLLTSIANVLIYSNQMKLALAGGALKATLQHFESENGVEQIKEQMQDLVDQILDAASLKSPASKWQLVVFIDDLDRCSPENMVTMFEWLKVHLNIERVTYVLALDHVAAARAIEGSYKNYLGNDEGTAYGFRYLEKLVDFEYELEDATQVEGMAVRACYQAGVPYRSITDIASDLYDGDFPGSQEIERLVDLRALRMPRTMLKVVGKFDTAMRVIRDAGPVLSGRLPASYPFWTLFLICMYFRLDPQSLADFVDGRSEIYKLLASDSESIVPHASGPWLTEPKQEFWQFCEHLQASAGSGLHVPTNEVLQRLVTVIRENILLPPDAIR